MGNIGIDGRIILKRFLKIGCESVLWIYVAQDRTSGRFL
jgi:hypothetical protein